jgi:N-terminal half of MaoC dehydratase
VNATTLISKEMQSLVGRLIERRVSFPVDDSDIRRWAIAVYYPQPPPARFIDATAGGPRPGIVAPEEFNPFAWLTAERQNFTLATDENAVGRTELMLGTTPPDVRHMLNGGMEVSYGEPMRPGDVITSSNRLAEYSEREGRFGQMLFTIFEDTWTNDRDCLVKQTRSTLIRY